MDLDAKTQRRVRSWMRLYAPEYTNSTHLAEGCADDLDIYEDRRQYVIPEDVYEIALEFFTEDEEGD